MSRLRVLAQGGLLVLLLAIVVAGSAWSDFERAVAARIAAFEAPETGVEVRDRDGALLRAFASEDGRWRLAAGAEDVDLRYIAMLVAWEDKRFAEHPGVDAMAFLRALWQSARHGRIVSGGSTLTMQVARMLGRLPTGSLPAKIEQILSAVALERSRDKAGILSLYLELAPYGGNLEGVRAASLSFFGKEPRRLTAAEAALLVALPQSPERYRPDRFPERARAARGRVIDRMEDLGLLDRGEAERARREAMPPARRELPMLVAHAAERLRAAEPARPTIDLTIDKAVQSRLEAYAKEKAATLKKPVSLAIVVADHATGEIIADIGSPDLFDRERQGFVDLTRASRSPGSTLKPLIYGLAFERGVAHPESLVDDSPGGFSGYTPQNFDRDFQGIITARRALQLSRNLPAVELLSAVGPARLVYRMRRAGAKPELGDRSLPGLAIGLGGIGLTLEDLVAIYGGLANGGVAIPLHIEPGAAEHGRRILSPQAAWYVTSILAGATTTAKGSPGTIAHKTGTSYGYRDAWTVGYDGRYVVGVWLGRPDGAPVEGLVGEAIAVPVMRDVFARLGPVARLAGPPPGILASAGGGLPPPLRRMGRAAERVEAGLKPEIVFPPNAARVEIGFGEARAGGTLPLKVRNGRPPFTWYVDGRPVAQGTLERQASWQPTEPGFLSISVVDGTGAAAATRVFVE
ncbi:MAG TPA: penicillin-binding protein 1C [Aurantimonas sp.]|nr:penicillin-binding protein 1C [Aurantimonas sp.]